MYRILYAEKADEDLTEIYSYIAADSPERAAAYLGKMESCILQLKDFPNIGYSGKYPELVKLGMVIPDGSVAVGIPARVIKPVTEAQIAANLRLSLIHICFLFLHKFREQFRLFF